MLPAFSSRRNPKSILGRSYSYTERQGLEFWHTTNLSRRVQRPFCGRGHKRSSFRTITAYGTFKRACAAMALGATAALQAVLDQVRGPIEAAQCGGLQSGSIIISIKMRSCHGTHRERMILVYYWMLELESDDFQSLFAIYTDPDYPHIQIILDQRATKYEGGVFSFRITHICVDAKAGDSPVTEQATLDKHSQYINEQRFVTALNVATQECNVQLRDVIADVSANRTRKRLASLCLEEDTAVCATQALACGGDGREPHARERKQARSAPAPSQTKKLPEPGGEGMAGCLQKAVAQMGAYASIPPKVRAWVQQFSSDAAADTMQLVDVFQATTERLAAALVDEPQKPAPPLHVAFTLPTHDADALHRLAELVAAVLHVCGLVQDSSVQKPQADHKHSSTTGRGCVLHLVTAGQEAAALRELAAAKTNPNVVLLLGGSRNVVDQLLTNQEAHAMFHNDDDFRGVLHMKGGGVRFPNHRAGLLPAPLASSGTKTVGDVAAGYIDDGFVQNGAIAPATATSLSFKSPRDQCSAVRVENGIPTATTWVSRDVVTAPFGTTT